VATILALTSCPMEGCHVIIFISQNPNPNFLLSFHPPRQPPPPSSSVTMEAFFPTTANYRTSSSRRPPPPSSSIRAIIPAPPRRKLHFRSHRRRSNEMNVYTLRHHEPALRSSVAGEEEEACHHCRQPHSQGRKEEGAKTLILEREYSAPRVSV